MSSPQSWPVFQVLDENGKPVSGAKIYTYEPGTTTDKLTYSDFQRKTPNANPTIADDRGEAIVYLRGATKFLVKDPLNVEIKTIDWVGESTPDVVNAQTFDNLADAVAYIGSSVATLYLPKPLSPATDWSLTDDLNISDKIDLRIEKGAVINAKTYDLVIAGPIEAGPYQIFNWSGAGTIDISDSPTSECPVEWWGALTGLGNDIGPALQMAYKGTGNHQTITAMQSAIYRLATPVVINATTMTPTATGLYPASLKGGGESKTVFYVDMTSSDIALKFGGDGTAIYGTDRMSDITFVGGTNCCQNAIWFENCYGFITDQINFLLGSSSYAVEIRNCENNKWDFGLGWYNGSFETDYGLTLGRFTKGVHGEASGGGGSGTYTRIRIRKTGYFAGRNALVLDGCWDWTVEQGDMENCMLGGADQNFYGWLPITTSDLYSGGNTAIAQTFTLTGSTTITNLTFAISRPDGFLPIGNIVASIKNTAAGAPTGADLVASHSFLQGYNLSNGNPFNCRFLLKGGGITLGAGTYAVVLSFDGGDASNKVKVSVDSTKGHAGTCYTYNGAAWAAQSGFDLRFAINAEAALQMNDCHNCKVEHIHFEQNWWDCTVDNCDDITFVDANACMEVKRSRNIDFMGANLFSFFLVDPVSRVSVDSIRMIPPFVFEEYGDTRYYGRVHDWVSFRTSANLQGNNPRNLMKNSLSDQWQADRPVGKNKTANMTWSKEAAIKHNGRFSAKLVLADDDTVITNLTADQLAALAGHHFTYSVFMNFPAGQSWSNLQQLQIAVTLPAWANATAYNVGDVIRSTDSSFGGICVMGGTSGGSEPTWDTTNGHYTVDGECIWISHNLSPINGGAADTTWSGAGWRRLSVSGYVGRNITAVGLDIVLRKQASDPTTVYLADETLNFGSIPSRVLDPGMGEFPLTLSVNGTVIVADAYPPDNGSSIYNSGYYFNKGAVCFNQAAASGSAPGGWTCTTAGAPGTWKAWANLP